MSTWIKSLTHNKLRMYFKYLSVFAIIAAAHAIDYYQTVPVYQQPTIIKTIAAPIIKEVESEAPAKYEFSYSVKDEHTGDIKEQTESRDGDVVRGSYSLIDSDGYKRIVDYSGDKKTGFNAVVRREPLGVEVKRVIAPVAKLVAAPLYYGVSKY